MRLPWARNNAQVVPDAVKTEYLKDVVDANDDKTSGRYQALVHLSS